MLDSSRHVLFQIESSLLGLVTAFRGYESAFQHLIFWSDRSTWHYLVEMLILPINM